jgi:hypothetical protein
MGTAFESLPATSSRIGERSARVTPDDPFESVPLTDSPVDALPWRCRRADKTARILYTVCHLKYWSRVARSGPDGGYFYSDIIDSIVVDSLESGHL